MRTIEQGQNEKNIISLRENIVKELGLSDNKPDRHGVYRENFGVSRVTFNALYENMIEYGIDFDKKGHLFSEEDWRTIITVSCMKAASRSIVQTERRYAYDVQGIIKDTIEAYFCFEDADNVNMNFDTDTVYYYYR